jgi:hypothetical protein
MKVVKDLSQDQNLASAVLYEPIPSYGGETLRQKACVGTRHLPPRCSLATA